MLGFDLPTVTPTAATAIGDTVATIHATVNNHGVASSSSFHYTIAGAADTELDAHNLDPNGIDQTVSEALTGLKAGTTYEFWLCTSAGAASGCSAHLTFTTTPKLPVLRNGWSVGALPTAVGIHWPVTFDGHAGTAHYEYGPTAVYGFVTPEASFDASSLDQDVAATIDGLTPLTTYHARLVATNAAGTTTGPDFTFTTSAAPAPTPTPVATPAPTPGVGPSIRPTQNGDVPVALALSFHAPPTAKKGIVTALLDAPLAGPIRATLTYTVKTTAHGKTKTKVATYGTATVTAAKVGTVTVTIKPSSAAKKALKAKRKLTLTFSATLTPSTGKPLTATTLVGVKA